MALGDYGDEHPLPGGNISSKEEQQLPGQQLNSMKPKYSMMHRLSWAEQAKLGKYSFAPQSKSRAKQINHLKKWLSHDKESYPEEGLTYLPLANPDDQGWNQYNCRKLWILDSI